MTDIEFVNHSSFVVSRNGLRLICDPWLEGSVFDDGWDLLAETRFSYEEFRTVTHLWFSHEHPDHFNPPTLKRIPPAYKTDITVLYQDTRDHRVSRFCKDMGFGKVIEMKPGVWTQLEDGFEVCCEPHDNGDSWLAIRTPECTLLNLNDCVVTGYKECREIESRTGPIDILLTQFSYANRVGNAGDTMALAEAAKEKLLWMKTQVNAFRPKYVIPFASFSFFSHEDNWYLNAGVNRIDAVTQWLRSETAATPVVLYPGDRWTPGGDIDSSGAIARYLDDYERVKNRGPIHTASPVAVDALIEHADGFLEKLNAGNPLPVRLALPSVAIFLKDHDQSLLLSASGLRRVGRKRNACDLECTSDALDHCLLWDWGGRTLDINGRFQVPPGGHYWKFKVYATLASFNSRGEGIGDAALTFFRRIMTSMKYSLLLSR